MLHLLAFALEPPPSHFEAGRGAEFHPEYMESVTGAPPRSGAGMVVGFAVAPGFRLGNGSVVRARVYLVPRGGRP
uniref:GIL1/IRKI C-terminal domain-containing protein n=1 Tax=Arundo donax TaxID=35708 RepID=A0A0A9E5J0_ARUDO